MALEFESTSLWTCSLAESPDIFEHDRRRLRDEFLAFRLRTSVLLNKIEADFPDLTVHDLTHIDELWRIASLLAGQGYPINPLEGFILGGAFLLHDAALCFEAYDGGRSGVRSTVEWKDAFAAESKRCAASATDLEYRADFAAVRTLHAKQSAKLAGRQWKMPDDNHLTFLIGDKHIREHLGPLIGEIAASHHQSIDEVASRFQPAFNAPGEFPSEWQVDIVKLACLLRCADALHLDNKRAPDFLHALRQRSGISHDHWQAQNWLGRPSIDPMCSKRETVLVTSTRPFPKSEANAWWVANDALSVADREIQATNTLLASRQGQFAGALQVKKVRGCERLDEMARIVTTEGWIPCTAKVHVNNVESLVASLGGAKLYGEKCEVGVALRELIQNARDAIVARRNIEPDYNGKIFVSYDPNLHALTVEDDGVGMSERVLTGPLLGFGTSFWSSDLVRHEFPGLVASAFESSGRFGIGFFSIFMAANAVTVSSRRYDDSYASTVTLEFPNGLTLRPLLNKGQINGFRHSTRITMKLKADMMRDPKNVLGGAGFIEGTNPNAALKDKVVSLPQYLGALCAALNVNVYATITASEPEQVHAGLPKSPDEYETWLSSLLLTECIRDEGLNECVKKHAHRLRPIVTDRGQIGLAAISTSFSGPDRFQFGRHTAGFLPGNLTDMSGRTILGFIETGPDSARRAPNSITSTSALQTWALEQFEILKKTPLNPEESFQAAGSLAFFGIDSREIARLLIFFNGSAIVCGFREVVELIRTMPIAIYKSCFGDHVESYCNFNDFPGAALIRPLGSGWNSLKLDENGIPDRDCSIIDFIQRTAVEQGLTIRWELRKNVRRMDVMGSVDAIIAFSSDSPH